MNNRAKLNSQKSTAKKGDFASKATQPNFSPVKNSPVDQVLNLQSSIGNQAVQRLFTSGIIKAKLKIGQPSDKYELEADRIAEQVMRMPDSVCPSCVEKKKDISIQQKGINSATAEMSAGIESSITSLKGGGEPLSDSARSYFEPRFGYDFSGVRVYTGTQAVRAAHSIHSKAFTVGNDIIFNKSYYSPDTESGKKLLAHELAHILHYKYKKPNRIFCEADTLTTGEIYNVEKLPSFTTKGEIKYFIHRSIKQRKLNETNIAQAKERVLSTQNGKELTNDLEKRQLIVNVFFYAKESDAKRISHGPRKTWGWFNKVSEKKYNVFIICGEMKETLESDDLSTFSFRKKLKTRNPESISNTIFHELLHIWFVDAFPNALIETGHTEKAEVTYDTVTRKYIYTEEQRKEYDPRFLKRLIAFQKELTKDFH